MKHLVLLSLTMLLPIPKAPTSTQHAALPEVQILDTGTHDILPGAIRPTRELTLSTSFDTMLGELRVKEGQSVAKGEIVAVLDDRVVRAAFRLAERQADRSAQIERAQATLLQAEDALCRIQEMRDLNAATDSEVSEAEAEQKIAIADLNYALESHAEASASLELARARLEEHLVRAPFDAIVVRVHAKPGALLSPGKPLLELVSVDGLCVDLYLPASIAATLRAGDHYALSVQEPAPAVVAARVRYVEPRIDPVSRTIRVVFDLEQPNPPARLFAGALARPAKQPALIESLETAISTTATVDVAKAPLDN